MLNHEGSHPEYYEELCALAASGQISEPEFVELQDHLQHCAQCRSAYADFTDLLHNKPIFILLTCLTWTAKARTSGHSAVSFTLRKSP